MADHFGNDFYDNKLYVIFEMGDDLYAVQSSAVVSIQTLDTVTTLPKAPKSNRGVITYIGQTITVVDTRVLMNMQPYKEELEDFVLKMEQAHEHWLSSFEDAIGKKEKFSLQLSPEDCDYGKWYRSYKTNNYILRLYLNNLEETHTLVHQEIAHAAELLDGGKTDEAREVFDKLREGSYAEFLKGLHGIAKAYEDGVREVAVICKCGKENRAFLVDKILSVERLKDTKEVPKELENIEYVVRLAYQQATDRIIKIVDAAAITSNSFIEV